MGLVSLLAVALVCGIAFMAQAQLFEKRPTKLGTTVTLDRITPVTFRLVVNDQQLIGRRSKSLRDGGGFPYKNLLQRTIDLELMWIELLTEKTYAVEVSIPVKELSRFDEKRTHAQIEMLIGPNGALTVTTSHPERLTLLRERKDDQITPEMDKPLVLAKACGTQLSETDPRSIEMAIWRDKDAVALAKAKRAKALANTPNYKSDDHCK